MSKDRFEVGDVVTVADDGGYAAGSIGIVIQIPHPLSSECTKVAWVTVPYNLRDFDGPFTSRLRKLGRVE